MCRFGSGYSFTQKTNLWRNVKQNPNEKVENFADRMEGNICRAMMDDRPPDVLPTDSTTTRLLKQERIKNFEATLDLITKMTFIAGLKDQHRIQVENHAKDDSSFMEVRIMAATNEQLLESILLIFYSFSSTHKLIIYKIYFSLFLSQQNL